MVRLICRPLRRLDPTAVDFPRSEDRGSHRHLVYISMYIVTPDAFRLLGVRPGVGLRDVYVRGYDRDASFERSFGLAAHEAAVCMSGAVSLTPGAVHATIGMPTKKMWPIS